MPRGHEDWGWSDRAQLLAPLSDLGELAARLGTIANYDRLGNVLFMDAFDDGLTAWEITVGGADSSVQPVTNIAYHGTASACLVGGSTLVGFAQITKSISSYLLTSVGVQYMFNVPTPNDSIQINIGYYLSDNTYLYQIRLYETDNTIKYLDSDGNYQVLTQHNIEAGHDYIWHTIKLVCDLEKRMYMKLVLDANVYQMSGIGCYPVGVVGIPHVRSSIAVFSRSGHNDRIFVDNVVFTINEV